MKIYEQDEPIQEGWKVKLYNGAEGIIDSIELGCYFFFAESSTRYHIMDVKYVL